MDEVTGAQLIAESLKAQVGTLQQQLKSKSVSKFKCDLSPLVLFNVSMHNLALACLRACLFAHLMFGPAESRVHVWNRWCSYY